MDHYSKLQSRLPSSSSSSSSTPSFPPHRTQLHPRMHYSFSSSSSSKPSPIATSSPSRWWIAVAAGCILPFLFYLLAAAKRTHLSSKFAVPGPKGFGVIIDTRRAGSRVQVFEYLSEGGIPFVGVDGKGVVSLKVRPGLGAFRDQPEGARSSVVELLEFARGVVPRAEWGRTNVRLMVTDGLRGVELDVKKRILESCRGVLRSSGFLFREEWVSMVTGDEKGLYAWVAANYALGTLGGHPQETNGIIEIDGASTQITFVSGEQPSTEFSHRLKLQGVGYNIYTRRQHHISQEGAWDFLDDLHSSKAIIASPSSSKVPKMISCIPKGYAQSYNISIQSNASDHELIGGAWGNFSACRSKILAFLKEEQVICPNSPCGVLNTFAPNYEEKNLNEDKFFYISELFGLVTRVSLLELEAAGRHYCDGDWANLKEKHFGVDEADLLKYCFSSAYIVTLLHDGIGIPMDKKSIGFTDQAGRAPLDWALGAFIMKTVVVPESEQDGMDHVAGDNSFTYAILFSILFFVLLAIVFVLRWQRPQFKMIYDLEKGHYIVTRMPR